VATARLRDLLLAHEALTGELQHLREHQAREDERSRLARDLHDSLAKTLHGATLLARRLRRHLETQGSPLSSEAELVETSLRIAQQEGREVLANLRQEPVHDLRGALTDLVREWQAAHGVRTELRLPPTEPGLPEVAKSELLRAVSEVLENVHRHAGAGRAVLVLDHDQDGVCLSIADDGVGLPEPDLAVLSGTGHFGLVGVHERMARIGGRLRIGPPPDGGPGTRVLLSAPLRPEPSHRVVPVPDRIRSS
jgi:signal transduction histidine kinase